MCIRFDPKEFVNDMIAQGFTKEEAVELAKTNLNIRKKRSPEQIKARNDVIMKSRGLM